MRDIFPPLPCRIFFFFERVEAGGKKWNTPPFPSDYIDEDLPPSLRPRSDLRSELILLPSPPHKVIEIYRDPLQKGFPSSRRDESFFPSSPWLWYMTSLLLTTGLHGYQTVFSFPTPQSQREARTASFFRISVDRG